MTIKKRDPYAEVKAKLAESRSLIYFDIETRPMKAWIWGLGQQYVTHSQIAEESRVISIQWMFEGDKKTSYLTWDKHQNDATMLEKFSEIMRDVKVAVSQNGRSFDHKVLQWRLNVHELPPLRDVAIIDTLTLSRQAFRAPSHKLDYRSKIYGLGGKIPMVLQDWIDVVEEKPGALKKMIDYGCKDIPDLRGIFWKELPYYKSLPISLSTLLYPKSKEARLFCPRCASQRQRKFDVYPVKTGNKLMMECGNCKHLWKETRETKIES